MALDTGYDNVQYCANVPFFSWDNWFGRCAGLSDSEWRQRAQFQPPPVGAPSGNVLTIPPANGQDAQATVDGVISGQMQQWQQSNANYVQPLNTYGYGTVSDLFNSLSNGLNNLFNGSNGVLIALGTLAVVAGVSLISNGSPRRYGR